MRLEELFKDYRVENPEFLKKNKDIDIKDIRYNSALCEEGDLFTALKGYSVDGHRFIGKAKEKGVRVFLVESDFDASEYEKEGLIFIKVDNTRKALAAISWTYFGYPQKEMTLIGITGTKGKTTVSNYLRDILEAGGRKTGIIGTMGCFYGDTYVPTSNTTPESYEIAKVMRQMLDNGYDNLAMEVSSGGIMNHRVHNLMFDYGIFLNLSHDHVGGVEHPTFEHYKNCKGELFHASRTCILNSDDEEFGFFKDSSRGRILTYALEDDTADYRAVDIREGTSFNDIGETFTIVHKDERTEVRMKVPGRFSIYNVLAAWTVADNLGIPHETIRQAMLSLKVKGRFEVLDVPCDYHVVIDYAHNGESIKKVLDTINSYNPAGVTLLTGSVGGRTHERRREIPENSIGRITRVVLTEDNPDFEDPLHVIEDMAKWYEGTGIEVHKEPVREKAVALALSLAGKDDVVLLAGKGHEDYNIVEGKKVHYSDHESVQKYFHKG